MGATRKIKKIFEREIKTRIDDLKRQVKNAQKYFEQGYYEKSRDLYLNLLKGIDADSDNEIAVPLLKNIGGVYFKLNDFKNSILYYSEALKRAEKEPLKFADKIKDIQKQIRLGETLKLAICGETKKALEICESFLEKNSEDLVLTELKGNFLHSFEKYEEAIICYLEILDRAVFKDTVYYKIGVCYFFLNDFENAWEYFQKSQKENPGNGKIYFALGETAFKKGDVSEALANFEKGEKMAPEETGFLIYLIECCRLTGQFKKIGIKAEKIIKSENAAAFELLLNWLCKIQEDEIKVMIMLKIFTLLPKKQTLLKKFQEILANEADELIEIIQGAEKLFLENLESGARGAWGKNKKTAEFIRGIMKPVMETVEQKKKEARELYELFQPFFEFQETYDTVRACKEGAKEALEFKLVQKVIEKCELPQEWHNFAGAMKLAQKDIVQPLKVVADFMDACSCFDDKATVSFDGSKKEALAIEENINEIVFKIFPDFPGKLDSAKLILLVKFYEKRLEYWEKLPDFINDGKFIPPPLMTARDWLKKTGKIPLDDKTFLEDLNREGNNFKLDLLMKKTENAFFKKTEPILKILAARSSSLPFKMRFEEKIISGDDKLILLVKEYYSYIQKNTKIK